MPHVLVRFDEDVDRPRVTDTPTFPVVDPDSTILIQEVLDEQLRYVVPTLWLVVARSSLRGSEDPTPLHAQQGRDSPRHFHEMLDFVKV